MTTAEAVLTAQALGKTPTSSADIKSAQGQFTSAQTIQMATAIKLVADAGVALPSGSTDTLALVTNSTSYTSFVTTQATTNATVFNATQAAVLADPTIAVAPPVPAAGAADVDMVLTLGQGAGASETDTGFNIRQLGSATATQQFVGSTTFTQGPDVGKSQPTDPTWLTETLVTATQSFHDTDFTVGAEWAGVLTTDFVPATADYTNQDTLKIVDATHVLYERTGVTGTYAISGGSLVVTTASGAVFSYTRRFTGPRGEERWLTTQLVAGAPTWVYDAAVVKVTAGLSFTPASATNDCLSYINAGLAKGQFYIDLLANGTGSGSNTTGTAGLYTPLGTWAIASDGSETLTRYYCESGATGIGFCSDGDIAYNVNNGNAYGQVRTWKLLASSGNNVYVMERLTSLGSTYDQYRVNVYTKTN